MPIAVSDATAVDDHATIGQITAGAVLSLGEFRQEAGEGLKVELVDVFELLDLLLVALVVRELMMACADSEFGEAAVGSVVCL